MSTDVKVNTKPSPEEKTVLARREHSDFFINGNETTFQ